MWLFCKSGFFSAVRHATVPQTIHLRARFAGDLERLCARHGIAPAGIEETPDGDYRFRMNLGREVWRRVVAKEAMDIDYTNFKAAVHDGTARDWAYFSAWAALRRGQGADR